MAVHGEPTSRAAGVPRRESVAVVSSGRSVRPDAEGVERHRAKYDWPGDRVRRHRSEERCRNRDVGQEM